MQTTAWMPAGEEALARDVLRWDSALCASACAFLREDPEFLGAGAGALTPAETEWLRNAQQPPVVAMQASTLNQATTKARITSALRTWGLCPTRLFVGPLPQPTCMPPHLCLTYI